MRKDFLFIMILDLGLVLIGCRAQRSVKASESRTQLDEIGVELHRVDSLWSTLAEKLTYKIEFYPLDIDSRATSPTFLPTTTCLPADPAATNLGHAQQSAGGGIGSVKSIEISTERTEDRSSITATDSVAEQKSASQATLQEDKTTEARQDNGTVTVVAIVAAAAILIFLLFRSKILMK